VATASVAPAEKPTTESLLVPNRSADLSASHDAEGVRQPTVAEVAASGRSQVEAATVDLQYDASGRPVDRHVDP
jgi:hypothetical protein